MRSTPLAVIFLLAVGCATTSHGAAGSAAPSLADSIATAARAHQPLVAEFGATWCQPCQVFAAQVLPDARVQTALHDVTFVQYDVDTPTGADAAHRCGVNGVPAVVVLDHDGKVVQRKAGISPNVDDFLAFLHDATTASPPTP